MSSKQQTHISWVCSKKHALFKQLRHIMFIRAAWSRSSTRLGYRHCCGKQESDQISVLTNCTLMTCRISLFVCSEINQGNDMLEQKITKLFGRSGHSFADLFILFSLILFIILMCKSWNLFLQTELDTSLKLCPRYCKLSRPTNS